MKEAVGCVAVFGEPETEQGHEESRQAAATPRRENICHAPGVESARKKQTNAETPLHTRKGSLLAAMENAGRETGSCRTESQPGKMTGG